MIFQSFHGIMKVFSDFKINKLEKIKIICKKP